MRDPSIPFAYPTPLSPSPSPPPPPPQSPSNLHLRLLTHNIRYATESPFEGETPWPNRLPRLLSQLKYHARFHSETILCLQEVLHGQLVDVLAGLNGQCTRSGDGAQDANQDANQDAHFPSTILSSQDPEPEWQHYAIHRDDGDEAGEACPIVYRSDSWTRVWARTWWLSETPDVPGSKGWDAASVRIVSGVLLERKVGEAGKERGRGRGRREMRGKEWRKEGGVETSEMSLGKERLRACQDGEDAGISGADDLHIDDDEDDEDDEYDEAPTSTERLHGPQRVLILNTHLDDQGPISRRESAHFIISLIRRLRANHAKTYPSSSASGEQLHVLLAGDLNSEAALSSYSSRCHSSSESLSSSYTAFLQKHRSAHSILDDSTNSGLRDARHFVAEGERYGHEMTFTGFDERRSGGVGEGKRIDFVFVGVGEGQREGGDGEGMEREREGEKGVGKTGEGWKLEGYSVLPNLFDDGVYISDHRAVVVDLALDADGDD